MTEAGSEMDTMSETARPRHRRGRVVACAAAFVMALALLGPAGPAAAAEYDPKEAGHPLRVVAYVIHPVGVALDYLVMRPAFWIGSHDPFKTLFGVTD
jgi:hypothetical protein